MWRSRQNREVAVVLGLLLLASNAGRGQEPRGNNPGRRMPRALLEERGATIRASTITVDNVFDPNNPEEDKALYRWANRVHIRTRPSVIENILLFEEGDQFQGRLLDESARALRGPGVSRRGHRRARAAYDAATNSVEVVVRVRDAWTLAPDLKLSRSGGENEWGIGLSDGNLFGTGKSLTVSYTSDVDRDETDLGYGDANVFGSRVRLGATLANASDGHRRGLVAERPFYSLDTRWSLGGAVRERRARRLDVRPRRGRRRVRARAAARSRCRAELVARRRSTIARCAGCSASRRKRHVSSRLPRCRSRCCCPRTASSSTRGSACSSSKTTIVR